MQQKRQERFIEKNAIYSIHDNFVRVVRYDGDEFYYADTGMYLMLYITNNGLVINYPQLSDHPINFYRKVIVRNSQ